MPIRQRGKTWQVDVRLVDGTRFRKTMPTKEMAEETEKAMTPNPRQRAISRYAVRDSHSKSAATVRSGKALSAGSGNSKRSKSAKPTSLKCVTISPRPRKL
jgi:hypothetical protein